MVLLLNDALPNLKRDSLQNKPTFTSARSAHTHTHTQRLTICASTTTEHKHDSFKKGSRQFLNSHRSRQGPRSPRGQKMKQTQPLPMVAAPPIHLQHPPHTCNFPPPRLTTSSQNTHGTTRTDNEAEIPRRKHLYRRRRRLHAPSPSRISATTQRATSSCVSTTPSLSSSCERTRGEEKH